MKYEVLVENKIRGKFENVNDACIFSALLIQSGNKVEVREIKEAGYIEQKVKEAVKEYYTAQSGPIQGSVIPRSQDEGIISSDTVSASEEHTSKAGIRVSALRLYTNGNN